MLGVRLSVNYFKWKKTTDLIFMKILPDKGTKKDWLISGSHSSLKPDLFSTLRERAFSTMSLISLMEKLIISSWKSRCRCIFGQWTRLFAQRSTKKKKKNSTRTAIYSLAYIYIKQVVHQINSWTLRHKYTVSQKKTSPTFLAITRESIVGFS